MKSLTLKTNELKAIIAKGFGSVISKDGFVFNKTNNEFKVQKENYKFIFNIEVVSWSNSFSIHPKLYVSQKQITTIIEKVLGKQNHDYTIGDEIGRIYASLHRRSNTNTDMSIWIREDQDVEAAIESLTWYYSDIAKSYFDCFRTLQAIDQIINNPPFDQTPLQVGGMFFERCIKGLIVAKLVDNPKYDDLVSIYDEQIKTTINDEFIVAYNKTKEFLMFNDIR